MKLFLCSLIMVCSLGLIAQKDSAVSLEVNFTLDSYSLNPAEKARIDSLLTLAPAIILKTVQIYGHTDSLASADYNRKLSKRRVQSVLQYLVLKGLDPLKVKTDFYGEERPKYDNGPEERPKNRRVELQLVIDASLLPPPEQKLTDLEFRKGDKIRIPNLNFVGNQPIPVWESFPAMEQLLEVMYTYPELEIELHGHVCCGDDYELSLQRALMVYNFLKVNGVSKSRMSYKGFSNSKPLFPEKTDREKALNRRVEVLVLRNSGRKVKVEDMAVTMDVEAKVLNLKFFPQKGRLYPSGDFMLGLITNMMQQSQGLFYEFVIFDNINNNRLTQNRAKTLERTIADKNVKRSIFKVRSLSAPNGMPPSENENYVFLKISQI